MELKIDLLKRDSKSFFRIAFGVIMFLLACAWIANRVIHKELIRSFDWIYFGFFSLSGVFHFIEGLGYSAERLFGKAYILINTEFILVKTGIFTKEQTIYWDNIKSINYNRISENLKIEKTDNANVIIDFYKFGQYFNGEIKEAIGCIAKERNIQLNA